jgi:hypothetical protein
MAVSPGRRPISSPPSSRARSDVTDGTPDAPAETRRRRLLYGRRKGPKLSAHQDQLLETLLPKLRLNLQSGLDPRKYFSGGEISDVWLEIGFGAGEHLLWQAEHHPDVGLIGAEPYISGIAKLLSRISLSPIGGEGEGEGVSTQFGSSNLHLSPIGGEGKTFEFTTTTRAIFSKRCPMRASVASSFCFPIRGLNRAITSAGSSKRTRSMRSRAR